MQCPLESRLGLPHLSGESDYPDAFLPCDPDAGERGWSACHSERYLLGETYPYHLLGGQYGDRLSLEQCPDDPRFRNHHRHRDQCRNTELHPGRSYPNTDGEVGGCRIWINLTAVRASSRGGGYGV